MPGRFWMPLYVGDYLADTRHLSAAQHGAYLLLLMHYWAKGGLPADERQLAKIAAMSLKQWQRNRASVAPFFGEGWRSARLDQEIHRMTLMRAKRAAAGSKGGTIASINRYRKR
jgi:uncharacterized protein YdaU (DUF1376 family)